MVGGGIEGDCNVSGIYFLFKPILFPTPTQIVLANFSLIFQSVLFMFGGLDIGQTMATTLTSTFFLLIKNVDVKEKLPSKFRLLI